MSLMQCRRAAEGVDGGGETADGRTDQLLDDLMEDLNNASSGTAAVRSVRVVEGSAQAQPEGGAQEVVVAGAGGPQPGHNGGAQGVMEGLSPDQQAVLRQAAEVLRTGCSCSGRLVRRLLWWMQEGDLNIFQGANNKLNELEAWIQGEGQRGDQRAQGVGDGGLLGPLALPAGGLEPLVLRPEGLPPAPQGDPVVLGPAGPHGGAEQQGHWCNMLDINLVLVNFFGILLILMGYKPR